MLCAHFDKNLQISTLFLNTWNCSLEHAKISQPPFDLSHARFDMLSAHFNKNLQISTLFLNTWKCSLEHAKMCQPPLDVPQRVLTYSAHILTNTCKFQH